MTIIDQNKVTRAATSLEAEVFIVAVFDQLDLQ